MINQRVIPPNTRAKVKDLTPFSLLTPLFRQGKGAYPEGNGRLAIKSESSPVMKYRKWLSFRLVYVFYALLIFQVLARIIKSNVAPNTSIYRN